jgi:hypothetical protein
VKFDIQKYASILLEAFGLEEQLRKSPPTNPTEYIALIEKIAGLYAEAKALLGSGVTPADITAAHALNQTEWADTKPKTISSDPTKTTYEELEGPDGAIAACRGANAVAGGEKYHVDQLPNGEYQLWDVSGPEPGVKVWP